MDEVSRDPTPSLSGRSSWGSLHICKMNQQSLLAWSVKPEKVALGKQWFKHYSLAASSWPLHSSPLQLGTQEVRTLIEKEEWLRGHTVHSRPP